MLQIFPNTKDIFIHIPKTAGTAIVRTFKFRLDWSHTRYDRTEIPPDHKTIGFVRDPVERFVSCIKNAHNEGHNDYKTIVTKSPEEIFTLLLNNKLRGVIWYKQSVWINPPLKTKYPVDILCDYARLEEIVLLRYGVKVGSHNVSKNINVEISPELDKRIREYYSDDDRYYKMVKNSPNGVVEIFHG